MAFTFPIKTGYLNREFVSHTRKVQNLFKRIARNEEDFVRDKPDIHMAWATVRAEFEKHRHVKDLRTAKMLLQEGEARLWEHQHPKPKKFLWSPGGLLYEREHDYPDSHLDNWHPFDKAAYPYYFERREQIKKDYIKLWETQNGKDSGPPKH